MSKDISDWFESGGGRALLREEARRVRRALDSVFGDQFLQIGCWGGRDYTGFARTQRATLVTGVPAGEADLVTAPDELGIASDSIDVVLLPHVLEFYDDPHGVLREVNRILRSDGHVIILGFNPVSIIGLRHLLTRRRFPPRVRRLIPEHRLRDWLRLLNFSVDHSSFEHYQPPLFGRRPHERGARASQARRESSRFDSVTARSGARFWRATRSSWRAGVRAWRRYAPFAGAYIVVVRRELFTMTMIRPAWKARRQLVGGLVNPTTRNIT